jgi:hypothetical protein
LIVNIKTSLYTICLAMLMVTLMGCSLVRHDSNAPTSQAGAANTQAANPQPTLQPSIAVFSTVTPFAATIPTAAAAKAAQPTQPGALPARTTAALAPSKSDKSADDLSKMLDDLTGSLGSTDTVQDAQ